MWQSGDDIFYVMFEKVRRAIWLTLSTLSVHYLIVTREEQSIKPDRV